MKSNMRRLIIDKMITEKGFVTFEQMQTVLKVGSATLKRDLRYMRDELGAPIHYSRSKGGYTYAVKVDLTGKCTLGRPRKSQPVAKRLEKKQWYSSDELLMLVRTINLLDELSADKSSAIYKEIEPLRARVAQLLVLGDISPKELIRRVKVVNNRIPYKEPNAFEVVGCGLSERRRVRIEYYTPSSKETKVREISPLRLVHYNNRWYVDAFCHLTESLRTFLIENIRSAEVLPTPAKRMSLETVREKLDEGYGIFHGTAVENAELRFDDFAASYVQRSCWHPRQKVKEEEGGAIVLTVPYSDPTELIGEILRWGTHVEVLAPASLRGLVAEEARRVAELYAAKSSQS